MSIIYSIASSNVFALLSSKNDLLPTNQLKNSSSPSKATNLKDPRNNDATDKLNNEAKAKELLATRNLISLGGLIRKLTNNPVAKNTSQLLPTGQKTEKPEANDEPQSGLLKSLNGFIEGAESKLDKIAQDVQGIINLFKIDQ